MKKFLYLVAVSFVMFSCGIGDAEKIADQYHNNIKEGNFQNIVDHQLSMDAIAITPKEEWLNLFNQVSNLGELKKIEKVSGFDSNMKNGVTTVVLRYKYDFAGNIEDLFEKITLVRDGGDFEIAGVAWNNDLEKLPMPYKKK
jgi:hypothetical protein